MLFKALLALTTFGAGMADYMYCQNNGTQHCDCSFGWTGPRCANAIDFCNTTEIIRNGKTVHIDVCGEHGDCTSTPNGAVCDCHPGWEGPYCHHNKDACQPEPCEGGGTCVDLEGPGYVCVCTQWRTGQNCTNYVDLCHLKIYHKDEDLITINPCGAHGNCTVAPSGVYCKCDPGYTGEFCEHRIQYNCTHQGNSHPHGSIWKERCNTCSCHFGIVQCETGHWCPERCAVYETAKTKAAGLRVGCATFRENCIPDQVACARENDPCDNPTGWCFPVGYVMLDQPTPNPLHS